MTTGFRPMLFIALARTSARTAALPESMLTTIDFVFAVIGAMLVPSITATMPSASATWAGVPRKKMPPSWTSTITPDVDGNALFRAAAMSFGSPPTERSFDIGPLVFPGPPVPTSPPLTMVAISKSSGGVAIAMT